jgi:predicted house-cleaning noncanonical NTP pyrophosphatase (MazG superfamily)
MKKHINKLVRDNIPRQIQAKGQLPITKTLDQSQFIAEVKKKLIEEAQEVYTATSREELIEEIADVLEVVDALASAEGITQTEINSVREQKNLEKGTFKEKIFLESVEIEEE